MATLNVIPVPLVQQRKAYRVPRHPAPMDLFLDGNEGQFPPASLYRALDEAGIEAAARYPKTQALEQDIAAHWGLSPDQVLVTAGGDDAIDRISRVMLGEGKEMLFPTPSFEMMARYGEVAGGKLVRVAWEPGAPYPLEPVLEKISEHTGIIAVISPNNPTGTTTSLACIEALSKAAPHAIVLLDLAYIEFSDEDPSLEALAYPNVLITRTFSKAWGLAGLRVGYALGHRQVLEWMRIAGEPYAVAGTSLVLAQARLREGRQEVEGFVQAVRRDRQRLEGRLQELGAAVQPSQANFAFARFEPTEAQGDEQVSWLRDGLAGLGISVRTFPENPALRGSVRITCPGHPDKFQRLDAALQAVLRPQCLLFDMDGVLVDVRNSYRQAILQCAASFGVELGAEDIHEAKALGDANNDWILTHRLLAKRGVEVPFGQVKERFEALYQGTPEQPGLHLTEELLLSREELQALSEDFPLAIVTGRPRLDAMRLLERFGLVGLFDAIVCMEDAPAKPDPTPVSMALEQLGLEHGWMLGDTPDDLRAARGAGVVPLGVKVPGSQDPKAQETSLFAAGAARVLDETRELMGLLELLPRRSS